MLRVRPIHLKQAGEFVRLYHRHNIPPVGGKFAIACYDGDQLCGVAICGSRTKPRRFGRYSRRRNRRKARCIDMQSARPPPWHNLQ